MSELTPQQLRDALSAEFDRLNRETSDLLQDERSAQSALVKASKRRIEAMERFDACQRALTALNATFPQLAERYDPEHTP